MKTRITLTAVAATLAIGLALPAAAKRDLGGQPAGAGQGGKPAGVACQQAGIDTLMSLGLLAAVAQDGIEVDGLGVVPFETVLSLHRTTPSAFQTGGVSVFIPGVAEPVPATWCDGL